MQAKIRQNWLKWHAYTACFFLPFIVLYAITGTLYLLDIKGSNSEELTLSVAVDEWPESRKDAERLALRVLSEQGQKNVSELPDNYFSSGSRHSWFGFRYSVALNKGKKADPGPELVENSSTNSMGSRDKNDTNINSHQVEYKQHGWWKRILYIHFGLAGKTFIVLGIVFGACLLFSALSGAILLLSSPRYRRYAQTGILSSCLIIIVAYFCV